MASGSIPLRRSPTDIAALLRGTVETLREQGEALDVSIAIDSPLTSNKVDVDAEKIAWAVATLVGNALRYVRRGTRRLPGGSIVVRVREERGEIVITVEDDGPGIPPEKCARLFVRGKGVTHGTGLGLMLIQDIAVAHGGTVEVESQCDPYASGTLVRLRIPAAQASTAGPAGSPSS